jgi:hypothetical protein
MIITKSIQIFITNKNISHYKKYYENIVRNQLLEVNVEHLPFACKKIITVQCDICNKIKNLSFHSYSRNISNYGYYACSTKCSNDKYKNTSLEKYNETSYTKTDECKEKIKNTKFERYGDENYVNIDKQKETNLIRFGSEYYFSSDIGKIIKKEKMIEIYGVEYPLQCNSIREKWIKTNNNILGCDFPLLSDDIKEKINNTKFERYGDENYNNRTKYQETLLNRYGISNVMDSEFFKNKVYNTTFERYGVKHPAQNPEIYSKMLKSSNSSKQFKDTNIYYHSSYELDFLNFYYDKILIEQTLFINYIFENNNKTYYPDFYIPKYNLIVEIKSDYWYNYALEKNLVKKDFCLMNEYNFLFIINKNYNELNKILNL